MSEASENDSDNGNNSAMAFFFMLIGVALLFSLLDYRHQLSRGAPENEWVEVPGLILYKDQGHQYDSEDSRHYYWPEVEYLYLVEDTLYRSTQFSVAEFSSDSGSDILSVLRSLSEEENKVRVNPNDPFDSVCDTSPVAILFPVFEASVGGGMVFISVLLFVGCVEKNEMSGKTARILVLIALAFGGMFGALFFGPNKPPGVWLELEGGKAVFEQKLEARKKQIEADRGKLTGRPEAEILELLGEPVKEETKDTNIKTLTYRRDYWLTERRLTLRDGVAIGDLK